MSVRVFNALVKKDLRLFFADRRAVLVTFALPIALASFFGFLFGGRGGKTETSRIAIQVVDDDSAPITRTIVSDLKNDKNLAVTTAKLDDALGAVPEIVKRALDG